MSRIAEPVYLGDMMDDLDLTLERISEHVPIADSDQLYLWELETQFKVYLVLMLIGAVGVLWGMLL